MALAGDSTTRRPIPHEPGEWVELQMLGWRALDAARQARTIAALRLTGAAGGEALAAAAEMQRMSRATEPVEEAPAAAPDPLAEYDLGTLLKEGIVAWSYSAPVKASSIDRLDERTAKWIAGELVGQVHETEGKGSNGWDHSIATLTAPTT